MVQIKLSQAVAFILAIAAIAPVLAIPPGKIRNDANKTLARADVIKEERENE
jgi:hypothetical protein